MGRRESTARRNELLTALAELAEPAPFHVVLSYALGTRDWSIAQGQQYGRTMETLVNRGDVVKLDPAQVDWWQWRYRLATDADRDAAADADEVARMMSRWEPA